MNFFVSASLDNKLTNLRYNTLNNNVNKSINKNIITFYYLNDNSKFELKNDSEVTSVSIMENGEYVAFSLIDGKIEIWNHTAKSPLKTLTASNGLFNSIDWSPSGKTIVSGCNKDLVLWHITDKPPYRRTENYGNIINDSINSNNKRDPIILGKHDGNILSVKYSLDGKYIASSDNLGVIKIWDGTFIPPKQNGGKKNKKSTLKLIDSIKKSELVKIAKEHDISLVTKDKKAKTKLQLFNSLKRKNLIK
jgi:WD40 repeat protein